MKVMLMPFAMAAMFLRIGIPIQYSKQFLRMKWRKRLIEPGDSVAFTKLDIPEEIIEQIAAGELQELQRRERIYRGDRPPPNVRGRIVILVDDGLATGSSMRAAIAALRRQQPARIIVTVPVGSVETCEEMQQEADEVICAITPESFHGVGEWYEDFSQTSDEEVRALLAQASRSHLNPPPFVA